MRRASLHELPASTWAPRMDRPGLFFLLPYDGACVLRVERDDPLPDPVWAYLVKRRDGWRCADCGQVYEPMRLHAHHLDRDRKNNTLGNGRTLCHLCHAATHADLRAGRTPPGRRPVVADAPPVEPQPDRFCEVCGTALDGRRRQARYCCASHRALASKQRRAA